MSLVIEFIRKGGFYLCLVCAVTSIAMLAAAPAFADEGEADEINPPAEAEAKTPPVEPENTETEGKTTQAESSSAPEKANPAPLPAEPIAPGSEPFEMLDSEVPPGQTLRLSWVASESFAGISVPTPVLVAHGVKPGPTLCLTAAVHGDELNGIEMVRRVLYGLDPKKLSGTVVGVPIVNLFGFRRASRYLPDRRDLNRYFPGDPTGSSASRIAYAFFESVVSHCDYLVDLHTGSFHRTNLPQLRADLENPDILKLTQGFGATAVLHNEGQVGTLRRAASDAGIPAVTMEAGEPTRFQPEEVAHGVKAIRTLLNKLGMVKRVSRWGEPQPVYYESDWIRADTGGILFSRVALGEVVRKDQILGTVTDPITNNRSEIRAPEAGRVLGMALNQVVIPGFASYRLGIAKSSEEIARESRDDETSEPDGKPAESDEDTAESGNGSRKSGKAREAIEAMPETPPKNVNDEERPD